VIVVVVVVGIVAVVAIIAMMIGHGVSNGRPADAAHDRAHWTAYHRSADRAGDAPCYRAALVR
jgi:hypothetical protein